MSALGDAPVPNTMTVTIYEAAILSAYIEMAKSSVKNGEVLIGQLRSLERCIGCKQSDGSNKRKRCDDCPPCGSPEEIQDLIKQLSDEIPPQAELVAKITGLLNSLRAQITPPLSPSDPQDTIMSNASIQALVQNYQADIQNAEVLILRVFELESEMNEIRVELESEGDDLKAAAGAGKTGPKDGKVVNLDPPGKALPLKEQVKNKNAEIRSLKGELQTLKAQPPKRPADDNCPEELKAEKEKNANLMKLIRSTRATFTTSLEKVQKENDALKASAPEQLQDLRKKLKDQKDTSIRYLIERDKLEDDMSKCSKELKLVTKVSDDTSEELKSYRKSLVMVEDNYAVLKKKHDVLYDEVERLLKEASERVAGGGDNDDCPAELRKTKRELGDITRQLERTQGELDEEKRTKEDLEDQLDAANATIEELNKEKGQGAASGDDDCPEQLQLTEEKLSEVTKQVEYYKDQAQTEMDRRRKLAGMQNELRAKIKSLEAEIKRLEAAKAEGAAGGDDDCPEELKKTKQELSEVTADLEKHKKDLRRANDRADTLSDMLKVTQDTVKDLKAEIEKLEAAKGEGAAGDDDDCPEELKRAKQKLSNVAAELETTKQALAAAQYNSGDAEILDPDDADLLEEVWKYIADQDLVVNNSVQSQDAIERFRNALSSTQAAHDAEVQKLKETVEEQQERIESLEAELALQAQMPSEQVQSLKTQIEALKKELKDCERAVDANAGNTKEDLEKCIAEKEKLKEEIKRKDLEFDTIRKEFTHGDYDNCDKRIEELDGKLQKMHASAMKDLEDQIAKLKETIDAATGEEGLEDIDFDDSEAVLAALNALQNRLTEAEATIKELIEENENLQEAILRSEQTAGGVDAQAAENTRLTKKLEDAKTAEKREKGLKEMAERELKRVRDQLDSVTKKRDKCEEKYGILKKIDEERTQEEYERLKQQKTPPTPGPSGGPEQGQNADQLPEDDTMGDDQDDSGRPDHEAEIEALNHQIIQLQGRITALESAAENDQAQIDALRSGSSCNKRLLQNIDKLRQELTDLQKQLDECRNETWQERRRRLRLAAAANRRPRGTVPPRANRRLDPALRQQQEWVERGWYKWGADDEPTGKRGKTKK